MSQAIIASHSDPLCRILGPPLPTVSEDLLIVREGLVSTARNDSLGCISDWVGYFLTPRIARTPFSYFSFFATHGSLGC